MEIRIFLDKDLIEVFINNIQAAITSFMDYKERGFDLNAYAFAGQGDKPMQIKKIVIWKFCHFMKTRLLTIKIIFLI